MVHVSQVADPYWSVAIGTRRAVLWIGGAVVEELPTGTNLRQFLGDLLSVRWQAVFVDTRSLPLSEAVEDVRQALEPWRPRVITDDPATIQLAANAIPVFSLQGDPAANPLPPALATLRRLSMLSRMPQGSPLFAVGQNKRGQNKRDSSELFWDRIRTHQNNSELSGSVSTLADDASRA